MPPTLIRFTRWLLLESAASASMVPVSTIPGRGSASHSGSRSAASADRKSTRLNSSHSQISYAVFCLKKKKKKETPFKTAVKKKRSASFRNNQHNAIIIAYSLTDQYTPSVLRVESASATHSCCTDAFA